MEDVARSVADDESAPSPSASADAHLEALDWLAMPRRADEAPFSSPPLPHPPPVDAGARSDASGSTPASPALIALGSSDEVGDTIGGDMPALLAPSDDEGDEGVWEAAAPPLPPAALRSQWVLPHAASEDECSDTECLVGSLEGAGFVQAGELSAGKVESSLLPPPPSDADQSAAECEAAWEQVQGAKQGSGWYGDPPGGGGARATALHAAPSTPPPF